MKRKIIVGILIIAIISITSGAYAFLSENANISNVDNANVVDNTNIADNNIPVNTDDSVKVLDNKNTVPTTQAVSEINDEVYIGLYAHYPKSEGIADHYIKCVECGGYIPIGEVTTPLPDAALCHGFNGILSGTYKDFAVSYEDAYNTWVEFGQPVYDDGSNLSVLGDPIHQHYDNQENYVEVNTNADNDMPLVDLTPCDDSILPQD